MQAQTSATAGPSAWSIGRLAEHTGTSPDTIRYYERLGLLPRPPRSAGRHRHFGAEHVRRLLFIRRARALGFTLAAIGSLLALSEPGRRSCAAVRTVALGHLNEVRAKLIELERLERALAKTVSQCTGKSAPACAVLSMLEAPTVLLA